MILIDTRIWIWLTQGDPRVSPYRPVLDAADAILVSAISAWEIAMLAAKQRIVLPFPPKEWVERSIQYPRLRVVDVSADIAVESVLLPGPFHADPAHRIIVATARVHALPLLTEDGPIKAYPHVEKVQVP
jgi:PIN domain nuclease of toxin-antitoxin system